MIEGAIGTCAAAEGTRIGQIILPANISAVLRNGKNPVFGRSVVVGLIGCPADRVARGAVALCRIQPVSGIGPAALVVGRFIPLVLTGNPPSRTGVLGDDACCRPIERVSPGFGARLIGCTIVHPVGKTRRVKPIHIGDRSVGATDHRVGKTPVASCPRDSSNVEIRCHMRFVKRVRVSLGHAVEECRVLPDRHLVFADREDIGHCAVTGAVGCVALVAHQHSLNFNQWWGLGIRHGEFI